MNIGAEIFSHITTWIGMIVEVLDSYEFFGVSFLIWSILFIVVNMMITIFWKGAKG